MNNLAIEDAAGSIAEYRKTEIALNEPRKKYAGTVYPVETAQGMKDAKEARAAIAKAEGRADDGA